MNEANYLARVKFKFLNPITYYNYITLSCVGGTFAIFYMAQKFQNGWLLPLIVIFGITSLVRIFKLFSLDRKKFKEPFDQDLKHFESKGYFQRVFLKNIYKDEFNN